MPVVRQAHHALSLSKGDVGVMTSDFGHRTPDIGGCRVIVCKSPAEIARMRPANVLVAKVLRELREAVRPGVTTADLDQLAEKRIRDKGGVPAFKGYHGYPATICASVNEQVIHGIPSARALVEGDILAIDVGVLMDGFYGDAAVTVPVGRISERAAELLRVTEESLYKGIEQARVGARVSDIGHAVQRHVESHGFSVVREFVGHGIGSAMHEEPQIPNYGEPGRGPRLAEGMVLAIEPMINAGKSAVKILEDGWTAVTRDGSLSAHFEHTVGVTASGPVILTTLNGAAAAPGASATSSAPGVTSVEAPGNRESRWRKRTR
jgi:methionyl aminopeptidase